MVVKLTSFQQQRRLICRIKLSIVTESVLKILRLNKFIYGYRCDGAYAIVYLRYYRGAPLIDGIRVGSRSRARRYVNKKTYLPRPGCNVVHVVKSPTAGGTVEYLNSQTGQLFFGELVCSV
jgi:hypothetical protein